MKIAIDIRYRVKSGASTYIHGLLPSVLSAAGDEFDFVLVKYDSQPTPKGAEHLPVIETSASGMAATLVWTNTVLPRQLKKHGVDLYHSMKMYGPARRTLPTVHTIHGRVKPRAGEFPMSPPQKLWHGCYGKGRFLNSCAVISVSEHLGAFLKQDLGMPEDKVRVIYSGINDVFHDELQKQLAGTADAPKHPPVVPEGVPYLLCLGNIEAVKNQATAVRALAQIRDQVPHHLVIAGRPEKNCGAELNKTIDETGMRDRVHLPGFVPLENVVDVIKSADLLIHPSTSEGLCFSIVEAMACGLPVIGSDIPGISEAAGNAGRYVRDPMDVDGFASTIEATLAVPALMQRMASDGRQRALAFSWDNCAQQTLAVYRQCLSGCQPKQSRPSDSTSKAA